MNLKKIVASLTALTVCAGMISLFPEVTNVTYASELVHNDFEMNYDGWYGNAEAVRIIAQPGNGYKNSRGMLVTGRTSPSDGASSSKGFYLDGGVNYTYSVWVYSDSNSTFNLSLSCTDSKSGEASSKLLTSKKVSAGKWTKLSAQYTAPKNSYDFTLSLNNNSTQDFRFDNFSVTEKSPKNAANAATTEKGLKDEFAAYFKVGNILNGSTVRNSTITANIIKNYNSIECENETKPDATLVQSQCSGTNIGVSLNSCAAIMDFCVKNNIAMRGHTLVWHSQTPQWFFKENFNANGNWVSSSVMDQRMESYIKNMFTTIKTQYPALDLYAYDVCNECISDDSSRTANNGGARVPGYQDGKSPWVQVYGDNSFIEKAFTYARKYAPSGCKLFYNDYNEYWDHKRDCIYNMCKSLYSKGILDGVGMQSHISAEYDGFTGVANYTTAMKKYLSIGCDVQITELDVSVDSGKYTAQQQADKYKAIFQAAMDWNKTSTKGKVTAVCIWGPNDANSWLKSGSNGLLFDTNNQPKLAYTTLTSMIPQSEWGTASTQPTTQPTTQQPVKPDSNGYYFHSTFENGADNWASRGSATVAKNSSSAFAGSNSLFVSGRESSWNGASYSLDTAAFQPGTAYSFSTMVKQDSGSAQEMILSLQYNDASGDTKYAHIATSTVPSGSWTKIENTSYKIPDGATDLVLYVETPENLIDFYMDEAIGAVEGTSISVPTQPTTAQQTTAAPSNVLYGDANCDGTIDISDVVTVRRQLVNGTKFPMSAKGLSNADVQQRGNGVNAQDAVTIQQKVLGVAEFDIPAETTTTTTTTTTTIATTTQQPQSISYSMEDYTKMVQAKILEKEPDSDHGETPGVQYGTVQQGSYYSSTCKRYKKYNVLLPAGYSTNKKYPVLYVMHGYWENQDRMIIKGNGTMYTRQIIGNAIASGEAEDMIVVFPYIYSSATQDSCTAMDDANNAAYDNFINDLTTDLMPYIEKTYSVKTGRDNTAITGFSMGGRESLLIGMKRPDLFGYVGAVCPAPGVTGAFKWNSDAEAPHLLFITAGSNDTVVYSNPNTYHENFTKNNVPHIWHYVTGGYHGDNSIHAHIYNFARAVFKATK